MASADSEVSRRASQILLAEDHPRDAEAVKRQLERGFDGESDARTALKENEERLSSILASAMDAIISVDERGGIVLFNTAAEKVFRCSASDAMGQPLSRFIPERFRAAHEQHVKCYRDFG